MHRFPDHTGPLFSKGDLYNVIAQHEASAKAMVADHDTDDFLSKTTQELIDIFMSHTRLVVPTLHRDREFLSPVQESHGEVRDYGRTVKLTGAIYQLNIPFTGDPEIFYHRPSRYSSSPPRAVVFQGQLRLYVSGADMTADDVKNFLEGTIKEIEEYLAASRADCEAYHQRSAATLRPAIEARQKALNSSRQIASSLGYKVHPTPSGADDPPRSKCPTQATGQPPRARQAIRIRARTDGG
jgi:hypothetical protein